MLTRTNIDEGCTVVSVPDAEKHSDGNQVSTRMLNFIQARTYTVISAITYAEINDILHSIIVARQKKKSSSAICVEKDSLSTNKRSATIVIEL